MPGCAHRAALSILLALVLLSAFAAGARAGKVLPGASGRAVLLVAGGPGGQRELSPLSTALEVGGYQVVSLAPQGAEGLEGLSSRIKSALDALAGDGSVKQVAVVTHGAGGLAALPSLRPPLPAHLQRVLFLALPVEGLALPPAVDSCQKQWRERVAAFYGPVVLRQSQAGAPMAKRVAQGLPLGILAGSIGGRLTPAVADSMLIRAGCAKALLPLPGDGVVDHASIAGLPGFGRSDRTYTVAGDHLHLPVGRQVIDLVLRFLKLPYQEDSVAVVLVIDGSGSVRSTDKQRMRDGAVRLLISRLMPGDQAAVVSFNTKAKTVLPLTRINSQQQAVKVAAAVAKLPAKGDTNIAAGLARAGDLLSRATAGSRKIVVLLTDGRNDPESNNGATLDQVRKLTAQGVKLHAVGLTRKVDELFLYGLAKEAGGRYLAAPNARDLANAFDRLQAGIDGRSLLLAEQGSAPASLRLLVDSTISRLDLSLTGPGQGLGLELIGPAGKKVLPRQAKGLGYISYTVPHPAPGGWTLRVTGPKGTPFRLQASAATSLTARLAPDKRMPERGKPWFYALEMVQDDLPLAEGVAEVLILPPGGREHRQSLRTRQTGGFSVGRSSAGAIAGSFDGFGSSGEANFRARVSGRNNLGEPFSRLVLATVYVGDPNNWRRLKRTLEGRRMGRGEQR